MKIFQDFFIEVLLFNFDRENFTTARVPPEITAPKSISVTLGKTHSFTIVAVSNVSTSFVYSVESNDSTVIMLNATSGLFQVGICSVFIVWFKNLSFLLLTWFPQSG